ncbi:3'(2'),5'-bisphosphate nucleotidase CysQ [Tistrella bauzanensis]|uniref:3'(2'),5'-bisphosphate nucleotidase CysQ n=1 Tax=Tistrella bauzanensis TaxID=657419 RepID=A0ABQ1J5P2_9PROT|nr:3'(2'),5'-bisphosphate nucleotidase CysQ [Tistrella bauzanensis]GGB60523.1 3'(2'),5'-bisphosphate nucleotidase CysQ [Tistrella bauzanensis]
MTDSLHALPEGSLSPDLLDDRMLLERALRTGGRIAMEAFCKSPVNWDKGGDNPVSEVDIAVDTVLRDHLLHARPGYGWLSEESVAHLSERARPRVWVVDPIDGTRAFLDGRPEFTISVALVEAGRPVLAQVFNPATGEFFEAAAGTGFRMNGAACRVASEADPMAARLLVSRRELQEKRWGPGLDGSAVIALGSIAYKLALVAAGRFDAAVSLRPKNDWDIAAADLMIAEAGGRMTDALGRDLVYARPDSTEHPSLIAANPALHAALMIRLGSDPAGTVAVAGVEPLD